MQLVTRTTYNNTGNLLSRKRNNNAEETFGYDSLDRLVSVSSGGEEAMSMVYAPNGNIQNKTGIGNYEYDASYRPHAVTAVDNTGGRISGRTLDTAYNGIGRIRRIDMGRMPGLVPGGDISKDSLGHGIEPIRPLMSGIPGGISLPGGGMDAAWEVVTLPYTMDIGYGPDGERWHSSLTNNGREILGTVYAGDYEKVTDHGVTREFYYLDANTIVIKRDGEFKQYVAFTDNLGSILAVVDGDGSKVFEASYDAWGRQTVALNTIGLQRGYCGHEMMNRFGLINMNGLLYDPDLGRFLSPDNYVQMPDNSQNFNRYSYCLNNPLKYTDPTGEFFGIDDMLFFSIASGAMMGFMDAKMNGTSLLKGAIMGGISPAASYGVGSALGHGLGTLGHELLRAGAHGLANGVINAINGDNFLSGLATGTTASLAGSAAQALHFSRKSVVAFSALGGGLASWALGGSFREGTLIGFDIGRLNHELVTINGEQGYMLDEVVITAKRINNYAGNFISAASALNAVGINISRNVVLGSNGRTYYRHPNNKIFQGNQFVSTKAFKITPHAKAFEYILDGGNAAVDIVKSIEQGGIVSREAARAAFVASGKMTGSKIGSSLLGKGTGWACGTTAGYYSLGIAASPAFVAGNAAGTFAGCYIGECLGEYISSNIFDLFY